MGQLNFELNKYFFNKFITNIKINKILYTLLCVTFTGYLIT
jgi:hypothetical protein